jgi:hypothetical protein
MAVEGVHPLQRPQMGAGLLLNCLWTLTDSTNYIAFCPTFGAEASVEAILAGTVCCNASIKVFAEMTRKPQSVKLTRVVM